MRAASSTREQRLLWGRPGLAVNQARPQPWASGRLLPAATRSRRARCPSSLGRHGFDLRPHHGSSERVRVSSVNGPPGHDTARGLRDARGCDCRGPRPCSRRPPHRPAPLQVLPGSLQRRPRQGAGPVCTVPVSPVSCDVLPGRFMPGRRLGVALPSCFRPDTDRCFSRRFLRADCMQTVPRKSVARDHLPRVRAVVGARFTPCPPSHGKPMLASCYFPAFLSLSHTYKYVVLEVIVYVIKFCHIKCRFYTFPTYTRDSPGVVPGPAVSALSGGFTNKFLESPLDPEELCGMSPPSLRFNKHSRWFCAALF